MNSPRMLLCFTMAIFASSAMALDPPEEHPNVPHHFEALEDSTWKEVHGPGFIRKD